MGPETELLPTRLVGTGPLAAALADTGGAPQDGQGSLRTRSAIEAIASGKHLSARLTRQMRSGYRRVELSKLPARDSLRASLLRERCCVVRR